MKTLECYMSSTHMYHLHDWIACIDEAADMGFHGMELFGGEGKTNFTFMDDARIEEIGLRGREREMTLSLHPWIDWCDLDEKELEREYLSLIKRCVRAGIRQINMHMGFLATRRQGIERVLDVTEKCLPLITENHIMLYYENVPEHGIRELGSELWDFEALFTRFTPETGVMLNIDTGHAHIMHEIDSLIESFGDRWKYTHINDNQGILDQHFAPGDGTLDFDHFAQKAALASYEGPLMMEYHQKGLPQGMQVVYNAYESAGYHINKLKL